MIVTYNQPNRDLVPYLEDKPYRVHMVGDVTGTNSLMAAIHGAANLARTL